MGNRNILHGSVRHTNPRTRQELQPKKHHNFIEGLLTPREPVVGEAGFAFGTTRLFLGLAVDAVAILRGPLRSRGSAHFRREQRNPLFLSGVGDRLRFTIESIARRARRCRWITCGREVRRRKVELGCGKCVALFLTLFRRRPGRPMQA